MPPSRRLLAAAAAAALLLLAGPATAATPSSPAKPTTTAAAKPTPAERAAAEKAALAAEQAAAQKFYRAVSAATASFVKAQIEVEKEEQKEKDAAAAAAVADKNATTTKKPLHTPLDVPNPLALINPNQTAELVLSMYPVGPAFLDKKPEAQQAAVRLRMEMAAATANLTAAVKLEQAQRALATSLAEGAAVVKALKEDPKGKLSAEQCALSLPEGERSACLVSKRLEAEAKINGTADVMAWLKWQESRLNTNLIFFLNWAFGANNATDGKMLAPIVVAVTPSPAAAGAASSSAAAPKQKVTDVLLFQGGGALANKTPQPPRGYDPTRHRLMDPTCAILAFWQVKHAPSDKDIAAKVGDLAKGKAGGSRWWNVAALKPGVALRRFDCAPFTWEEWASGKRV